jgi:hypothetical protein
VLLQDGDEKASRLRSPGFTLEHDFSRREFATVDIRGRVVVGSKRRTLERDTGKQTARSGVAQYLGAKEGIRVRGGIAAHRTGRDRSIAT